MAFSCLKCKIPSSHTAGLEAATLKRAKQDLFCIQIQELLFYLEYR